MWGVERRGSSRKGQPASQDVSPCFLQPLQYKGQHRRLTPGSPFWGDWCRYGINAGMEYWGPGEEMTINWWRQVRSVLGVGEVSRRRDYWPQFSKKARIFGRKKAMSEKTDLKKWSKFDNKWGYLVTVMSITQELQ